MFYILVPGAGVDRLDRRVTIRKLPDDVLVEIFDFYLNTRMSYGPYRQKEEDAWHTLVHVCRRWRYVVFESPLRLRLQLRYTQNRPVPEMLKIWPELPIVLDWKSGMSRYGMANNILAVLGHSTRITRIDVSLIPNSILGKIRAVRGPFPILTDLVLVARNKTAPVLSRSFLGGSAPQLRSLKLTSIAFPQLPNLLTSTHNLVTLHLWDVPLVGYISPAALVTGLSISVGLQQLRLEFRSPRSLTYRENPDTPPPTRHVFPHLTFLQFKGDSEYLEEVASRLEAPRLGYICITFFNKLIFENTQLRHLISHTEGFNDYHRAEVTFQNSRVCLTVFSRRARAEHKFLELMVACEPCDWQLSAISQICGSLLPPIPSIEYLEISQSRKYWQELEEMDTTQWQELLQPFTSVTGLVLSSYKVAGLVAPALQELGHQTGENITVFLPALREIFIKTTRPQLVGSTKEAIEKFVADRKRAGRGVALRLSAGPLAEQG